MLSDSDWHSGRVQLVGSVDDEDGSRDLYVAHAPAFGSWPSLLNDELWRTVVEADELGFAVFIALDASDVSSEQVARFASYLIDHGAFWVSTWGPGCERVHDVFDQVDAVAEKEDGKPVVLTTWHDQQDLGEATLLFWTAFSDEGKQGGPARIAIAIGSEDWFNSLRALAEDHIAASA